MPNCEIVILQDPRFQSELSPESSFAMLLLHSFLYLPTALGFEDQVPLND